MERTHRTPDEIWAGDMLDRRSEAEMLIPFLETVALRPDMREDAGAYTLAIDASYGFGKSYFLRRLADHLSINHPVAFIDAWTDDLADEPLTALISTLKDAVEPQVEASPDVRRRFDAVMSASGRVAKIVGKGLLRKAAALAISAVAVDELEKLGSDVFSDAAKDALKEGLTDSGKEAVENAAEVLEAVPVDRLMRERVESFEAGRKSISMLKDSLTDLISSLTENDDFPPVFIVIDELDRCRPTYAVKLLEEIKHLFDVRGLVFIFGLHGDQLAHSVSGAYGAGFNGRAYLKRFFRRTYTLELPTLARLIAALRERIDPISEQLRHAIPSQFWFPTAYLRRKEVPWEVIVSGYFRYCNLSARDAIQVMEMLETCRFVVGKGLLILPYLLPLLIQKVSGLVMDELQPPPGEDVAWTFVTEEVNSDGTPKQINLIVLFQQFKRVSRMSVADLSSSASGGSNSVAARIILQHDRLFGEHELANPANYTRLIEAVARLST